MLSLKSTGLVVFDVVFAAVVFFVKHRLIHLDLLRGLAALLVCVSHLRAFLFVDFGRVKAPGIWDCVFYFVTGFGHQSVMIFFVMSGFLVGGSVISAYQKGKWSWHGYALRRLTRLWMVLIPALLLTLMWDTLGQHQAPSGYQGAYHAVYNSGPEQDHPADLRPATFLGNALFLQTIDVNCYGTNGPLWSLANEFWYYLLFPLLLGSLFSVSGFRFQVSSFGDGLRRLTSALLAVAVLILLPWDILMGGLVWLTGAAVFFLIQKDRVRRWAAQPIWLATSTLMVLGLLAGSRFGRLGIFDDLLLGGGFACLVAALAVRPCSSLAGAGEDARRKSEGCWGKSNIQGDGQGEVLNSVFAFRFPFFFYYSRLSISLSEFSYTLYLVHFPLLAFLFYTVFKGQQMSPGIHSTGWFAVILTCLVIYAAAIYWCFERNTDRVRKKVEQLTG